MNDSREFHDVESICSGKIIPRSQSTGSRSKSSIYVEPRPKPWNLLGTSGNVFDSPRAVIDSSSTPYQGMLHSWNQSATGENPVRESAGKPVVRSEERIRETIPTLRIARRPSTMNSFFQAEGAYPHNYMVDQQRRHISELQFPTHSTYSSGKMRFKTKVSSCSVSPSEAMSWIKEVKIVDSVDD